jgi:hypothetical protein
LRKELSTTARNCLPSRSQRPAPSDAVAVPTTESPPGSNTEIPPPLGVPSPGLSTPGGSVEGGETAQLAPLPGPKPKRKIDLSCVAQAAPGNVRTVESLRVQELKGVGAWLTPQLTGAVVLLGLVYRPPGEYAAAYQILGPSLQDHPLLRRYAKPIAFVPVYSWCTLEVVLMPVKLTSFGRLIIDDLRKLAPRFPHFKAFLEWDGARRRHLVHYDELPPHEKSVIDAVQWPRLEEVLETLSAAAYDSLDDLMEANEDIHAVRRSRVVE